MGSLEEQMKALLAEAAAVNDEAAGVKAEAGKVKRKSKELEESLGDMAEASDAWNRISGGRRSRRGSRDPAVYNDDALKEAFNTVDTDRSGQIDRSELTVAIRAMDPHAPDHVIVDMIKFADADADGKVDFGEFKKILLFKPATTTPPTPPPPTSRLPPSVVEVASAPTSGADKSSSDGGDTPTRVGYIAPAQETA